MKKALLLLLLGLMSQSLWAQKFTLKGIVGDSTGAPVEMATVILLAPKDSSLQYFTNTDEKGGFEFRNISANDYLLNINYVGYKRYFRQIAKPEGAELNLGRIILQDNSMLKEVTVTGDRVPVVIKQDTIEFNAEAFKTQPNAVVEDLIKRMPGIQIEKDGSIYVNGKKVQKVLVDGKEFFANDPKLATKNLPADAIDKVQVFERRSDQAVFSGVDDGEREMTVNLTLKEDKKKGMFGRAMAGGGTNERFEARANLNRFSKGNQLSIIGTGNNINQQGFGVEDAISFSSVGNRGGGIRLGGGDVPINFGGVDYGFITNYAGGLNMNQQLSSKTELNGSYFFNSLTNRQATNTLRQNFLPNGNSFNSTQSNSSLNENINQRINLRLEHKIDSLNSLVWTANAGLTNTQNDNQSNTETFDLNDNLQNNGFRNSLSEDQRWTLNTNLLWRHRFAKRGRTFSLNGTFALNTTDGDGSLLAENNFFTESVTQTQLLDQVNERRNRNYTYGANAIFTEPIARRKFLELSYNFRKNLNEVNQEVFDMAGEQRTFNPLLSNQFESDYTFHRGGLSFRMNEKKLNFTTGLNLQYTELDGRLLISDTRIYRTFTNILPTARLDYNFSQSNRLTVRYETSVQEPNVQQLQPVINNSDPLNISVGNPDLRPAFNNQLNINYFKFNQINFSNFFANLNLVYTTDAIVNAQTVDERLIRTTQPVNVSNSWRSFGTLNYGMPINKLKSRVNLSTNLSYSQGFNVLNNVETVISQNVVGGSLRYSFDLQDKMNFLLGANLSRSESRFESNSSLNQSFLNQTYTAETFFYFLKVLTYSVNLDYLIYKGITTDFYQEVPMLGMGIAAAVFKDRRGELKLSASNLLNQNVGANQNTSVNFIEQQTIASLGRYYMLSFTYSFNPQLNPNQGNRQQRNMFRMFGR